MNQTFEYVLSAIGQGFLPANKKLSQAQLDEIRDGFDIIMKIAMKNTIKNCPNYTPKLAYLFNAFSEKGFPTIFTRLNGLGLDTLYADSGGLQVVTVDGQIDLETKLQIYKTQTYADYAMCFDVIPLTREIKERTSNERTNTANKIYHADDIVKSGLATGKNIKQQIMAFKEFKAKTKVVLIVQGNNYKDMIVFF